MDPNEEPVFFQQAVSLPVTRGHRRINVVACAGYAGVKGTEHRPIYLGESFVCWPEYDLKRPIYLVSSPLGSR